jgi:hypothetical protein
MWAGVPCRGAFRVVRVDMAKYLGGTEFADWFPFSGETSGKSLQMIHSRHSS